MKIKLPQFGKKKLDSYNKSELLSENSSMLMNDAYGELRTNLKFLLSDGKKVVAFTSANAHEGKTTTCLNTAIDFARAGHKVVVLDMDMRRPRVHRYFDVPASPGLSDKLGNFVKQCPILPTEYENLFVVPVGTLPPSPPELLMASEFDSVIAELKREFEYIFIDTTPINVVKDIAIIATMLDGVVFVVRENATTMEEVKHGVENLTRVKARILGFILNDSMGESIIAQYQYKRKSKRNSSKKSI